MEAPTRFHLLRHAPVVNPGGKLYGRDEIAADTSNTALFQALAATVPAGAAWVVSPLSRTRATAAAIRAHMASASDEADPVAEPDLIEQDFGDWCGLSHDEIARTDPERARRFWDAPARVAPPGGESFAEVTARVGPALARLGEAHAGRDVIVVTHGGVIRAALAVALKIEPELVMPFCVDTLSTTRLDRFPGPTGAWRVVCVNSPPVPAPALTRR